MSVLVETLVSRYLELDRYRLHYLDGGVGEAVVMVHGADAFGCGWADFHRNVDAFIGVGLRVLLIDCPGFGQSGFREGGCRYTENAYAIRDMLDALRIDKAHILGHAMGGGSALTFALLYPERVGKLVLIGSDGVGQPAGASMLAAHERCLSDLHRTLRTESLRSLLETTVHRSWLITDRHVKTRMGWMARNPQLLGRQSEAALESLRGEKDLSHDLSHVEADTLVVWGREDRLAPLTRGMNLLEGIPNVQLHVLGGCGHWVQWERAHELNALVTSFIVGDARPAK